MILKSLLLPIAVLSCYLGLAQDMNFSFENPIGKPWLKLGDSSIFKVDIDRDVYYSGKGALRVQSLKGSDGFGGVMLWLPSNLKGDSIQLSAKIKREKVTDDSYVGMMLQIVPNVFFDNMYSRQIKGTKDWEHFTIKAKLKPDQTEGISIAFFLQGEGTIWIDDVTMTVDNKDITKESGLYGAFAKGISDPVKSGVVDFYSNPETSNRLVDLARIWGFLKYRHPEVAKGKIDWDKQLFTSMNAVIFAKDEKDVETHYDTLLESLGDTPDLPKPDVKEVVHEIDYAWIDDLPLNLKLKNKLKQVRYTSFENHYYFDFTEGAGNVVFKNERKYDQARSLDVGLRLLALFRFWNMIEYFSPYKHLTEPSWDEVLKKSVPEMIEAADDKSYALALLKVLGQVKDAHTGLWSWHGGLKDFYGQYRMPVEIRMIEGKAVVTRIFDINQMPNMLKIGDVVLSKELKKVEEIRDSLWTYIGTPNEAVANRELAKKLVVSNTDAVPLIISRDGTPMPVVVHAVLANHFRPINTDTVAFKMLDNNILYIKHNLLRSKMIDDNLTDWSKVKGVIIDNRNYPGDFLVFKVAPLFLSKPTGFVRFSATNHKHTGTFVMSAPLKVGKNTTDYYRGKVAVLVNGDTQSSAEYHAMAYQTGDNVKIFGSQTAGADGNASEIDLPGNQKTMLTGLGIYYPDSSATQRAGIKIDYTVSPTIDGIKKGRDEVLEKAIEYINSN